MLRRILEEILFLEKISAIAVIGRDGFVVEIVHRHPVDADALGSFASSTMQFFEQATIPMNRGPVKQMVFEYDDGAIILTPASSDEVIAVISETCSATGRVLFVIERNRDRVVAVL